MRRFFISHSQLNDSPEPPPKVGKVDKVKPLLLEKCTPTSLGIDSKVFSRWEKTLISFKDIEKKILDDFKTASIIHVIGRFVSMTEGIKDALIYILKDFQEALDTSASNSAKKYVLMYYGVPNIGKSSLSLLLSYYLGSMYGSSWHASLRHEPNAGIKSSTNYLLAAETVDEPTDCDVFIIDQVNPTVISAHDFVPQCQHRKAPVIIFTSGHYVPTEEWCENERVQTKVIHITVTTDEVYTFIRQNKEDANRLVRIASTYGQVLILNAVLNKNSTEQELKDKLHLVYQCTSSNLSLLLKVMWSKYCCNKMSFQEAKESGMFNMDMVAMRKVQDFSTDLKVVNNKHHNTFISQIIPLDLTELREDPTKNNPSFCVFPVSSTKFYISQYQEFYAWCTSCIIDKHAVFKAALALYEQSKGTLHGQCLEVMTREYCRLRRVGLVPDSIYVYEASDTECLEAHDIQTFLDQLRCQNESCNLEECKLKMWFSLDVLNKPKYPGFDFIYISGWFMHESRIFRVEKMVLIQLAINVQRKLVRKDNTDIMVGEYNKLKTAMMKEPRIKLHDIDCYFYVPYQDNATAKGRVTLQLSDDKVLEGFDLRNVEKEIRVGIIYLLDFKKLLV